MLVTPKKTPVNILDALQSEIFSTPKRPLRDRNSSVSPSASGSPHTESSLSPEKGVTFSAGLFYQQKSEYLNPFERMVAGKPKIYIALPVPKAKPVKVKSKKIAKHHSVPVSRKSVTLKPTSKPNESTVQQSHSLLASKLNSNTMDPTPSAKSEAPTPAKQYKSPSKITPRKRTSPRKSPTSSTLQQSPTSSPSRQSPRKSPTSSPSRQSPRKSPTSSPLRQSPPRKRKFFVSRSPSHGKKRWMSGAFGKPIFTLDFSSAKGRKQTSPNPRKRTPPKSFIKETTTPNKKIKLPSVEKNATPNTSIEDRNCSSKVTTDASSKEQNASSLENEVYYSNGQNGNTRIEECTSHDGDFNVDSEMSEPNVGNIIQKNLVVSCGISESSTPDKCYPIFSPSASKSNSQSNSPNVQRLSRRSNRLSKCNGADQMVIDAGQRELGPHQCPSCSMIYSRGDSHDELMHSKFHESFHGTLRFAGWKKERVVGKFLDGRVIMILPSDPNFMLRKVHEVRQIVDRELGISPFDLSQNENSAFLLYVTEDRKIVGCIIAETISCAYRVLRPSEVPSSPSRMLHSHTAPSSPSKTVRGWFCSTEATKALCGINRIWTDPAYRRCKIGTRMVDSLRCHFIYGQVLEMDDIAFSDPTEQGKAFATNYTATETFLVYK